MKLRENLPMGVMKPYEVHDAIYFRVQCDCMGEDHDLTIYSEEEHGSGINFSYKSKSITPNFLVCNSLGHITHSALQ